MKSVVAFVALFGSVLSTNLKWRSELDIVDFANINLRESFSEWRQEYGKDYGSPAEEYVRFGNWMENLRRIAKFNSAGKSSSVRMNQFGDMTDDEFRRTMLGDEGCYRGEDVIRIGAGNEAKHPLVQNLGASVDWTSKGCVTAVKNQEQCGSCWAFSTTGAIECNWAIGHNECGGSITSLSEQQLVDCSKANAGCNGGNMASAMNYVASDGGLCSESEYPYTARDGTCKSSSCGTKYDHISGHQNIETDSESALETAVNKGCVSVAIEADQFAFQYYSGGVLTGTCGTNLDHGVLVTGYGTQNGQDYWKVKNSWGTSWGEQGYVLICRNCNKNGSKGECGILMDPVVPTGA